MTEIFFICNFAAHSNVSLIDNTSIPNLYLKVFKQVHIPNAQFSRLSDWSITYKQVYEENLNS